MKSCFFVSSVFEPDGGKLMTSTNHRWKRRTTVKLRQQCSISLNFCLPLVPTEYVSATRYTNSIPNDAATMLQIDVLTSYTGCCYLYDRHGTTHFTL